MNASPEIRGHRRAGLGAFSLTFMGSAATQGLGVLSGVIVARLLGPVGRGEIAAIYNYPSLLALVGCVGLQQAVAYTTSRNPDARAAILKAALLLAAVVGIVEFVIAVLVTPYLFPPDKRSLVWITQVFMLYIPLNYLGLAVLGSDQGAFRFTRFNVMKALVPATYVVLLVALWFAGLVTVVNVALANLAAQAAMVVVRLSGSLRGSAGVISDHASKLFRLGLSFQVPQIMAILLERLDLLLGVWLLPLDQLGLYAVGVSIALGQQIVTNTFIQVGFVRIAQHDDSMAAAGELAAQFRAAQVISFLTAIVFCIASTVILRLAFGARFLGAASLTRWLIVAVAIGGVASVLDNGLRALKQGRVSTIAYASGCLVMLCGALVLQQRDALTGLTLAQLRCFAAAVTLGAKVTIMSWRTHVAVRDLVGFTPRNISFIFRTVKRGVANGITG